VIHFLETDRNEHLATVWRILFFNLLERNYRKAPVLLALHVTAVHGEGNNLMLGVVRKIEVRQLRPLANSKNNDLRHSFTPELRQGFLDRPAPSRIPAAAC
jgi:hypothetical protein